MTGTPPRYWETNVVGGSVTCRNVNIAPSYLGEEVGGISERQSVGAGGSAGHAADGHRDPMFRSALSASSVLPRLLQHR